MLTDNVLDQRRGDVPDRHHPDRGDGAAVRMQFGIAGVMGFDDVCVQSKSTARIASAWIGMAPYYATDACDQGPQVLKSDAGGPSIPFSVPALHLRRPDQQRGAVDAPTRTRTRT